MSIELSTLPDEKQHFVVGVSSGVDSMVLLHLLAVTHHEVTVAHINYKTRDPGSDQDQRLVEEVCKRLRIPFRVKNSDKNKAEGNFQQWARNQRYAFFDDVCEEFDAKLVLAHHADDLLETQLLKLARGESFLSSSGYSRKNTFYPLLSVSKQELYDYADEYGILFNEDQSNASTDYDRNFLRHDVISKLKERFPNVLHHALILKESSEGFNESVDLHVKEISEDGELNRKKWQNLPQKLRALVFSKWLMQQCGTPLTHAQFNSVDDVSKLETGQLWTVNEQWSVIRNRDYIVCVHEIAAQNEFSKIKINTFPYQTDDFRFEIKSPEDKDELLSKACLWVSGAQISEQDESPDIILRNWKDGDYMSPLGMTGKKKIQDLLTDEKIPAHLKKSAKVLVIDNEIAACLFPSEKRQKIGIIGELFRCNLNQSAIKITRL